MSFHKDIAFISRLGNWHGEDPVVEQIEVRIADVDSEETQSLTVVMDEFATSPLVNSSYRISLRDKDLVVTIVPGELSRLKNALQRILNIVDPDRIDIEA